MHTSHLIRLAILSPLALFASPFASAQSTVAPAAATLRSQDVMEVLSQPELSLPALDDQIMIELPFEGNTWTLDLVRSSQRAESFTLQVVGSDGVAVTISAPAPLTFRGIVRELPDWRVAASLEPDGLTAMILPADGDALFVEPASRYEAATPSGRHLIYRQMASPIAGACGTLDLQAATPQQPPATSAMGGNDCFREADLAVDIDVEYYQAQGSSTANVMAALDARLNAVNAIYARDVQVRNLLSHVLIRTAQPDPYTSFDPGTLLDEFRAEWNGPQSGVTRDMAHLITGRDLNGGVIGLAWVSVVCNLSFAYGWSQWTFSFATEVTILGHELGHNWSAPHCLDESCVLMCGGCHEFGPKTAKRIRNYARNAACLVDGPGEVSPIAPRADDDSVEVFTSALINVLANDVDGNCDTVSIDSFDTVSANGGVIALSPGTGPGGRDELSYSAPLGYEGLDTFTYVAGDGTGLTDGASVSVRIDDGITELVLHYKLDETSGTLAQDSSVSGLDGTYWDSPALGQAGAATGTNTAVGFDGNSQRVRFQNGWPMDGLDRNFTVSAWVRPDSIGGIQRILANDGSWGFGLNGDDLFFTTFGIQDYQVNTSIQSGVWHHVAMMFTSSHFVRFFVDGNFVGTVIGNAPADAASDGWYLATLNNSSEFLDGAIDDLQVYDGELTGNELQWLFENPGSVISSCPSPTIYCSTAPNSAGSGAQIGYGGSSSITADDLLLTVTACPTSQFGIFYYAQNPIQQAFGDGFRCAAGSVNRLALLTTNILGEASQPLDYGNPPTPAGLITPGSTWLFQFWFRDPAGPGGTGFNLSDGLEVEFCN
ncbi:MAG: hypothetical protein ACI841_004999 [Planctomycetota bacterium]|jgi:hypothetical protein